MQFWKHPDYQADFEYARRLTAHYSKSFYASASILPIEKRWATYAVYAFCRYTDNLTDNPRARTEEELLEETNCLMRELSIAFRTGESEHPILRPFILVARRYNIPEEYALELVRGVQMDLCNVRYETFDDLYIFCYRVASVVGLMMTHVFGCQNPIALEYAEKMGIAMQLTNILRDVHEDIEMQRIYLPLEDLDRFDISEQQMHQATFTENIRDMMIFQTNRAHEYYHQSTPGIALLPMDSQYAVYSAAKIYRGILDKIRERNHNPFLGRVFVSQHSKIVILMQEILKTRLQVVQQKLPVPSDTLPNFPFVGRKQTVKD